MVKMTHLINRNIYGDLLAQHQPKAIKTEAKNEAAILLAESLEHQQRNPEEEALLELLIISKAQAKILGELFHVFPGLGYV